MSSTAHDVVNIYCVGSKARLVDGHHNWDVKIQVNGEDGYRAIIDPISYETHQEQRGSCLERYIDESVRRQERSDEEHPAYHESEEELQRMERQMQDYCDKLWTNLDFTIRSKQPFLPSSVGCQINVFEAEGARDEQHTIHRLAWELLEAFTPPGATDKRPYAISITRKITFSKGRIGFEESLRKVQEDDSLTFRILLVIARDLSNPDKPDLSPDIAQYPLMFFKREFERAGKKHRLHVEVVRPGTLRELKDHLNTRGQHVKFHLVHFDLHGHLKPEPPEMSVISYLFDDWTPH